MKSTEHKWTIGWRIEKIQDIKLGLKNRHNHWKNKTWNEKWRDSNNKFRRNLANILDHMGKRISDL